MAKRPYSTMARFPRPILNRLHNYGLKGQTYADIVVNLMDKIDRDQFIEEQFSIYEEAKREQSFLRKVVAQ